MSVVSPIRDREKPFRRSPTSVPHTMPIFVLLLISLAAGFLIGLAFDRLAPAKGATTAAADAVETAIESSSLRTWWRVRTDPEMATGLALTAAVVMVIGGGVVIGLLAYLSRGNATLASIDSSAAQWGNDHATELSTRSITWVTDLGNWPIVPLIGIPILIYELRRSPNRSVLLFLVLVFAGDKLVTNVIKALVDRARPTLNPIAETLGPSFPSGHASTAASFYAALALILARGRSARVRALLAGAAGGIAIAVASSRVLLDVHWLSDVIAGLLLGWAWFALCAIAFGGRRLRFAEPAEQALSDAPHSARATGSSTRPPAKV
jgi:membrane-associated phospholipid phosphatase